MKHDFFEFMEKSTTAFQTVAETTARLERAGYEEVHEKDSWTIQPGDKRYVVRNDSSVIAFSVPAKAEEIDGFHMVCAHTDSPCFKIKEHPDVVVEPYYRKLNIENYGGMRKETWLDRPLSVAGRVVLRKEGMALESVPVDMERPLFIIPSLAVHMKKDGDKDGELNTQVHLQPLGGTTLDKGGLYKYIAEKLSVEEKDILGADLYLYPIEKPVYMGLEEELIGAPRLDDLSCVYSGVTALLSSAPKKKIAVLALFDNEEVGSRTMQGADSDFLVSVLGRICDEMQKSMPQMLAQSLMISADNAHAWHPNYTDKADPTNRPVLGGGIVIKYHGAQKYTTSGYSGAYVKALCEKENIPYQTYHNRSDIAGGSTLGNIALTKVSVAAADIGLAQLSMHSAFETAGREDLNHMIRFMTAFLNI